MLLEAVSAGILASKARHKAGSRATTTRALNGLRAIEAQAILSRSRKRWVNDIEQQLR